MKIYPFYCKYCNYFFGSFTGLLWCVQLEINALISNFYIIECINNGVIMLAFMLMTSIRIIFIQFELANKLIILCIQKLQRLKSQRNLRIINAIVNHSLHKFMHFHTICLLEILSINQMFGSLLFHFLILNTPVNAYLIISLINGKLELFQIYFVFMLGIGQFLGIFAIHWIGINFTQHIHKCTKPLIHCYLTHMLLRWKNSLIIRKSCHNTVITHSNNKFEFKFYLNQLRLQLKLNNYLFKFHTNKRYGITCGAIGLITFKSFTKVSIFFLFLFSFL